MSLSVFKMLDLTGRAMSAQRKRLDVVSSNLANAETTAAPGQTPYRRQDVIMAPDVARDSFNRVLTDSMGTPVRTVEVVDVREDTAEPKMVYRPDHPHANEEGYVAMPNVNTVEEMVDMITTMRSYQANLSVFSTFRELAQRALTIGKG